MGLISLYHEWTDGYLPMGLISAIRLNTNFKTLYDLLNGNLDEENINPSSKILVGDRNLTISGYTVHTNNIKLNACKAIQWGDLDSSTSVGLRAPSTVPNECIWTLPATDGTNGQILSTDGSGNLIWVDNEAGSGVSDHGLLTGLGDDDHTQYSKFAFKTISVSGQSNVVATTRDDALTLVAGSNITITTGSKSVTIAASSGGSIPAGIIVMWSGLLSNIPSGWHLCDGTSGTPDLREKFIKGSAAGVNPGVTGGSNTHTHDAHSASGFTHDSVVVAAHSNLAHSGTDVSAHNPYTTSVDNGTDKEVVSSIPVHTVTQPSTHTGISHTAHTHTGHGSKSHSTESNEPVYYSLAFIMKL